jgi:low affinity Fe/Cu permease
MKTLLKMVADFFKREWFLFVALGAIALIIAFFEILNK